MCCAIGKLNMNMIDAVAYERLCEVEGIAGALLGLYARAVFLLMPIDKLAALAELQSVRYISPQTQK